MEARRASRLRQQESFLLRIGRGRKVLSRVERRGDAFAAHGKKRRLASLELRLAEVERDIAEDRVRICFGSRKLFHAQYALEANGYATREKWLADWRSARGDFFFVLGSRDESGGNQACVATVREDGKLDLRLRLPDRLVGDMGSTWFLRDCTSTMVTIMWWRPWGHAGITGGIVLRIPRCVRRTCLRIWGNPSATVSSVTGRDGGYSPLLRGYRSRWLRADDLGRWGLT